MVGDARFTSPGKPSRKLPWNGILASASKPGNSIWLSISSSASFGSRLKLNPPYSPSPSVSTCKVRSMSGKGLITEVETDASLLARKSSIRACACDDIW